MVGLNLFAAHPTLGLQVADSSLECSWRGWACQVDLTRSTCTNIPFVPYVDPSCTIPGTLLYHIRNPPVPYQEPSCTISGSLLYNTRSVHVPYQDPSCNLQGSLLYLTRIPSVTYKDPCCTLPGSLLYQEHSVP